MAGLLGALAIPALIIGTILYPFIVDNQEQKEADRWNSLTDEEKWQEKLQMIRKLR